LHCADACMHTEHESERCLRRSYVRSCWVYWLISHTRLLTRGGLDFRIFAPLTGFDSVELSGVGALSDIFQRDGAPHQSRAVEVRFKNPGYLGF